MRLSLAARLPKLPTFLKCTKAPSNRVGTRSFRRYRLDGKTRRGNLRPRDKLVISLIFALPGNCFHCHACGYAGKGGKRSRRRKKETTVYQREFRSVDRTDRRRSIRFRGIFGARLRNRISGWYRSPAA